MNKLELIKEVRKDLYKAGNKIMDSEDFSIEETSEITYHIYMAVKMLRHMEDKEGK